MWQVWDKEGVESQFSDLKIGELVETEDIYIYIFFFFFEDLVSHRSSVMPFKNENCKIYLNQNH